MNDDALERLMALERATALALAQIAIDVHPEPAGLAQSFRMAMLGFTAESPQEAEEIQATQQQLDGFAATLELRL